MNSMSCGSVWGNHCLDLWKFTVIFLYHIHNMWEENGMLFESKMVIICFGSTLWLVAFSCWLVGVNYKWRVVGVNHVSGGRCK